MGRYFIKQLLRPEGAEAWWESVMLVELTPAEARAEDRLYGPLGTRYEACHWTAAHEWVRRDRIHATGLWIDDGRVRYAASDPG